MEWWLAAVLAWTPPISDQDASDTPWTQICQAIVPSDLDPRDGDALLFGIADEEAVKPLLSAFLDQHLDAGVTDPIRRALLQRDLWAAFDRVDGRASRHLKDMLAQAIRRLALDADAIAALPGPTLPDTDITAGLFDTQGPWVQLQDSAFDVATIAPSHDIQVDARSLFTVHLALPDGRAATLAYLALLRGFPGPLIRAEDGDHFVLNPATPQVPVGTRIALLRRALLVDRDCNPVVSPLVESIEVRRFLRLETALPAGHAAADPAQQTAELRLDRQGILDGSHVLREVGPGEQVANILAHRYHGESRTIDRRSQCMACHAPAGIFSVNTWKHDVVGCAGDALAIPRPRFPRLLQETDGTWAEQVATVLKRNRASFGELRTLW